MESVFGVDAEDAVSYDGDDAVSDENRDGVNAFSIVKEDEILEVLQ